jgi:hypothetical protein
MVVFIVGIIIGATLGFFGAFRALLMVARNGGEDWDQINALIQEACDSGKRRKADE